jgi:general secretion pathway protein E
MITKIENIDISFIDIELNNKYKKEFIDNNLLLTKSEEEIIFVTKKGTINNSFDFYNNNIELFKDINIYLVEDILFDKLENKYKEEKKDVDIENLKNIEAGEEEIENIEDILENDKDLLSDETSAPIIKFVDTLFYKAIKEKASDIHIESHEKNGLIRLRKNGVLVDFLEIEKKILLLVISRIKVISNLDIAERRLPQDGRTQIKINNNKLDIRVSSLPTYFGEKIVMRVLMQSSDVPDIKTLGYKEDSLSLLNTMLSNTYGIILVTGPTGSGKSTTLHAFLHYIYTKEKNIITIEDPIEFKNDNINQIQVNHKLGLSFAIGLKSILRQDPDIILIGEIRDKETAKIAFQAAQTGHLVLSTLHTNNTTSTITRLIDMGIDPFLISSSLLGVISQRLYRNLCDCKEKHILSNFEKENLKTEKDIIFKEKGCFKCDYSGYINRKAFGEILLVDDIMKTMITDKKSDVELREYFKKDNKTLNDNLLDIVLSGNTSYEDYLRLNNSND